MHTTSVHRQCKYHAFVDLYCTCVLVIRRLQVQKVKESILMKPVQPVMSQLESEGGKYLHSAILNAVVANKVVGPTTCKFLQI